MDAKKADLYALDLSGAYWTKSSKSTAYPPGCVEVTDLGGGAVAMRDSNNPETPALRFTAREWAAFRDGVRDGEFG
ncbi:DUF397 domain-containing protein [Streptomyces sp. NPDC047453]|uniref:DUF397 domain-containing protein n=1 Tax=Streptomyces sp. NPDC047453 TaxID=3154812 RepID=UPI0033CDCA9E